MATKMVARPAAFLAVALALVLAAAPARGADASSDAPAGARLLACHRSPSIDQRVATVGTWMRPIAGGRRLAVKIDLWERLAGQRWALRTDVPGLGGWTTPSDAGIGSQPGDVFKYRQAVGRLEAPAAYRFEVAFHWLDADGAVVREVSRTTAVCRQPDVRPDLVLRSVMASPADDGSVRYVVRVGNEGKGTVARAVVAVTLPGDAAPGLHSRVVRALAPGTTAVVRFTGPGCAASEQPASFLADPSNALDEVDETNNALSAVCPAP
jgi:CARDB